INLAKSLINLENYPQPELIEQLLLQAVEEARTLADVRTTAYALGTLGKLYEEQKQWEQALEKTQDAIRLTEKIQAPELAYQWEWQLGRLLRNQGEIESAVAAYKTALRSIELAREDLIVLNNSEVRFSFLENIEPVYREYVNLLFLQNAQSNSEQKSDKQVNQPTQSEQNYLQEARETIEALQVAELENFLRCQLSTDRNITIDNFIETNNLQAAVIYPIILPERLETIVKLPHQSNLLFYSSQVSRKKIEDDVKNLRKAIKEEKTFNNNTYFQEIYNYILPQNLDIILQNNQITTLVFVLDGALKNLPIAALYDGTNYLIEKYSLVVNLGLQLFDSPPLRSKKPQVLAAGISESVQNYQALEFVDDELQEIKSKFPTSKILLNDKFLKKTIQDEIANQPYSVVHLATHGQFSSDPESTFIISHKDRIQINEIKNIFRNREKNQPNPIHLLVLSACETATGDSRAALGIAGISIQAGARSTIASLFPVNDLSTSLLMRNFYTALKEDNLTKAEALRRSQLALLSNNNKEYAKPYYWSPFILIGDWR
ncbi:MAG: CHAT domain-containing protein, partial [Oscillatoria sp. PMC 1068.18]|nr:CHAT domain-containing protein [Oscillatoria sp. PMC 1068.18]